MFSGGRRDKNQLKVTVQPGYGRTDPQELSKQVLCMIRIVILSYISVFFPEEPALLLPKMSETPSRGPLAPLYGGKGNALWGSR